MAAYEVFANEGGYPVCPSVSAKDAYGTFYGMAANDTYSLPRDATGVGYRATGTTGVGYAAGAGGAVTQITDRTTGVEINKTCGAITLISAAGSTTIRSFTVTNSTVAATDTVNICQKSGTDLHRVYVTNVADGSFQISYATLAGTTTEQPVFNFAVIKAVAA